MAIPGKGREILSTGDAPNWLINGVHPLSFLMATGGKVSAVTAVCNDARNGILAIRFANGAFGTLHSASGPQPRLERYAVYADNWQVDIENTRSSLYRGIPIVHGKTTNYAPEGMTAAPLSGKLQTVKPVWRIRPSSLRACTLP